jgi:TonB family protein
MMRLTLVVCALGLLACGEPPPEPETSRSARERGFEPPVATNATSPVGYPLALYDEGAQGTVILRLFIDERGTLVPESTQVAEGSGYVEFDSAAVAGVTRMEFAPARRNGQPVPTAFLQPIHFRHPDDLPDGARQ